MLKYVTGDDVIFTQEVVKYFVFSFVISIILGSKSVFQLHVYIPLWAD